jgi:hypothetical protein
MADTRIGLREFGRQGGRQGRQPVLHCQDKPFARVRDSSMFRTPMLGIAHVPGGLCIESLGRDTCSPFDELPADGNTLTQRLP